jgi:hypothetical protein
MFLTKIALLAHVDLNPKRAGAELYLGIWHYFRAKTWINPNIFSDSKCKSYLFLAGHNFYFTFLYIRQFHLFGVTALGSKETSRLNW